MKKTKTPQAGIYKLEDGRYFIQTSARDPETLRRISEAAGLDFHATPQTLRRTVNTIVVERCGEVVARQILGHSAPAMTHHYAATSMQTKRDALTHLTPRGQVQTDLGVK